MKHQIPQVSLILALLIATLLAVTGCAGREAYSLPDPQRVEAFTSGEISRWSSIKVVFTRPVGRDQGTLLSEPVFHFAPAIRGVARWADPWTTR